MNHASTTNPTDDDDFVRLPGLFRRWEIEQVVDPGVDFHLEEAGEADAGFGLQAAAAQLGLAFVPLLRERYAFACRRRELLDPRARAFRRLIASTTVAKVVAPLPGYRLAVRERA